MRLWWSKKPAHDAPVEVGPLEGEKARRRAEQELEKTVAETPLYRALGESLREIRERNHLTELFYEIHRGR